MEQWKDIPRFEGLYQASNLGNIRTCKNKITHTNYRGNRVWKQRILKGRGNCKSGYRVSLWKDGKSKDYLISRLIATTFLEDLILTKITVNHKDGNRFNNELSNLEWLTLKENIQHGFENGLYPQIKVKVINKLTLESNIYRSQSLASISINKTVGYISNMKRKNKFENKLFKWEIF